MSDMEWFKMPREAGEIQEGQAPSEVMLALGEEKRELAVSLMAAMAVKFNVEPWDFVVVRTEDIKFGERHTVAYGAHSGIEAGNRKKIAQGGNFVVNVDGKHFDTRAGMTRQAYVALIDSMHARNVAPLPDTLNYATNLRTKTLLTGEVSLVGPHRQPGYREVALAFPGGGIQVEEYDRPATYLSRAIRFRPAVHID